MASQSTGWTLLEPYVLCALLNQTLGLTGLQPKKWIARALPGSAASVYEKNSLGTISLLTSFMLGKYVELKKQFPVQLRTRAVKAIVDQLAILQVESVLRLVALYQGLQA